MTRCILPFALLILLLTSSTVSAHGVIQIGDTDYAGDCAVAMDGGGTVAFAWCRDGNVYTGAINGCYWLGPDNHGPGTLPELCWLPDGFKLAWVDGSSVRIRSWSFYGDDEWSDIATLPGDGQPILSLTLTGWQPAAAIDEAYLCWETADDGIWFSRGDLTSWQSGESVLEHGSYDFARPHAQPILSGSQVWPRIYYMDSDDLLYVDGIDQNWSAPATVPGFIGSDFEAAAGPGYSQHLLALGPQPTCPCNFIQYTEQPSGGAWLPAEEITVAVDEYDWPQYPRLGVDAEGRAHAFWYQQAADLMMNPTAETQHYFVRDGGVWFDESGELDEHFGIQGDLAMDGWGGASMIWNESGAMGREIWLATTATIGIGAPVPDTIFDLGAYPNPFNPRTVIRFQLPEAAAVSVGVFDIEGRRLRSLAEGQIFSAGISHLEWDGRDDGGHRAASGLYLVHFETMGEMRSLRAVLLK